MFLYYFVPNAGRNGVQRELRLSAHSACHHGEDVSPDCLRIASSEELQFTTLSVQMQQQEEKNLPSLSWKNRCRTFKASYQLLKKKIGRQCDKHCIVKVKQLNLFQSLSINPTMKLMGMFQV